MLGGRQGGADVARRMCACLFCIFGEDCVKYERNQADGRESFRQGALTRPFRLENSPSPRRRGALLLPWCYVTARERRKYGWWYLQGMNQRWREGFITPQAPVTEGTSPSTSQLPSVTDVNTANDSNDTTIFAFVIRKALYLTAVDHLLITTILLEPYGSYLLLSSSFIGQGPPDTGQTPGDAGREPRLLSAPSGLICLSSSSAAVIFLTNKPNTKCYLVL